MTPLTSLDVSRFRWAETFPQWLMFALLALCFIGHQTAQAAIAYTQATVTRLENDVSYGRQQGERSVTRPAVVQDTIKANNFLVSERRSRAELQYADGAIVRVGENTVFSFEANTRTLALSRGMFFFYVPKGKGGAILKTPSIAAAITGTVGKVTVNSIIILDGSIRLIPSKRTVVAGQFARRNPDGSITIGWFDKSRAPGGVVSANGAMIRKGLEREVLDLVKYQSKVEEAKKPVKPTPTPVAKPTDAMVKAAAKTAANDAARMAAQNATRSATTAAAAAAAATASKTASKSATQSATQSASKAASQSAAKPSTPHHYPSGGGGMKCFVAGTLVHTPSGLRKIEDLKIHDEVLSYDQRTGEIEPATVLRTWKSQRADLVKLGTPNGSVICSQNHRFYTAEQEWLEAYELKPGDKIMVRDPAQPRRLLAAVARSVIAINSKAPVNVYNLTVARNATYFVGPDAILCHNVK